MENRHTLWYAGFLHLLAISVYVKYVTKKVVTFQIIFVNILVTVETPVALTFFQQSYRWNINLFIFEKAVIHVFSNKR